MGSLCLLRLGSPVAGSEEWSHTWLDEGLCYKIHGLGSRPGLCSECLWSQVKGAQNRLEPIALTALEPTAQVVGGDKRGFEHGFAIGLGLWVIFPGVFGEVCNCVQEEFVCVRVLDSTQQGVGRS